MKRILVSALCLVTTMVVLVSCSGRSGSSVGSAGEAASCKDITCNTGEFCNDNTGLCEACTLTCTSPQVLDSTTCSCTTPSTSCNTPTQNYGQPCISDNCCNSGKCMPAQTCGCTNAQSDCGTYHFCTNNQCVDCGDTGQTCCTGSTCKPNHYCMGGHCVVVITGTISSMTSSSPSSSTFSSSTPSSTSSTYSTFTTFSQPNL